MSSGKGYLVAEKVEGAVKKMSSGERYCGETRDQVVKGTEGHSNRC